MRVLSPLKRLNLKFLEFEWKTFEFKSFRNWELKKSLAEHQIKERFEMEINWEKLKIIFVSSLLSSFKSSWLFQEELDHRVSMSHKIGEREFLRTSW